MKKFTLSVAVVAAALMMGAGEQASAGHHGLFSGGSFGSAGSSGGSFGSYGSSGGSTGSHGSYGSSGGSSGSYGSHGSVGGSSGGSSGGLTRREARLIYKASKASSGGSYGSTGSSGGSYGSHGSHGSSGGSSGGAVHYVVPGSSGGSYGGASYGGYHTSHAPSVPYRVATSGATTTVASSQVATQTTRRFVATPSVVQPQQVAYAYVVVNLPQDATLQLGGHQTTTTGAVRKFKIPVTDSTQSYPYAVRVELTRNGQRYVAQSTETLVAGKTVSVQVNDVSADAVAQVAAR